MPTPDDYSPDDWTPQQWKAAWDRGAIGQSGYPLFPPSERVNSRGDIYNPARVGTGGVNTGVRFPRGDEQPPAVTPAAYKPGDPQPPARPENISDPTPPVTPGQYSPVPWGHPQVAAVPPVPRVREPHIRPLTDGTLTPPPDVQPPNRFWNPVAPQQPFADQINRYSHEYGIPPNLLSNLLRAESGFNPRATGPMTKYGQAGGIAQFIPATAARYHINPYDPDQGIRGAAEYLRDLYNEKGSWAGAVAAYNGSKSIDTSQYRGSPEGRALIANAVALDGGLVKAGPLVPPPQNYRPESYGPNRWTPDRPPSQWGRDTPDMFSGIGAIPHQREIPGIMKALAPLLMVGLSIFSKGAALPMLSFYGGYLKASAAKQDKDAKELKTKYQDQLKELKAKMGIELAAYGGAGGDMSELRNLAVEFGDQTLLGILDAGKDPGPLLQQRDRIFKDTSKTDLAERRFELSQQEFLALEEQRNAQNERANAKDDRERKAADDKEKAAAQKREDIRKKQKALDDEAKKWGGGSTTPPAEDAEKPEEEPPPSESTPAPAEPEPAPPTPSDSDTPGPGGAATPPAGATPASAEAAPTSEPPPTGGEDQVVDAQGNPIRPRSDVVPADYRGPTPQATPVADTSGGAPATPSPLDTKAAGMVMGDTDLTGIPKAQQDEIQYRAAKMQQDLNAIPRNLQGRDAVDAAVRRINPQMADTLDNILDYRTGIPSEGATSGGQGGRMNPFWQRMASLAGQADPGWNPGMFHTYQRQRDDFAGTGKYAVTLGRSNRLLSAAAAVLQATNELGQTLDESKLSAALQAFNSTGIMGDPEYTRLAAAWRNFALESTAVSQGGVPPVTTSKALMDMVPIGSTLRQIRAAVQTDIYSSVGSIDTARQVWQQLPENRGRQAEPLGFIPQAYDGLNIIASTLNPVTGAMSPTYTDEQGMEHTVPMPPMLQKALPSAAPAAPAHTDSGGWSITPVH